MRRYESILQSVCVKAKKGPSKLHLKLKWPLYIFLHWTDLTLRSSVLNATKNIIYWVLHLDLNNGVFVPDARPLFTGLPINRLFGLCETQQPTSLNGTILVFVSDKNLSCLCGFVLKTFIHLQRQEALAVGLGSTVDSGMWDET